MLSVDEAILSRRSVRAFRSDPVSRETVEHILEVASRAPSGTNTQPWRVHVLMDQALERVSGAVLKEFWENSSAYSNDRPHYMDSWRDPYLARRRKVGWDLYALMGIKKGEREKTQKFHSENYRFFGAPVGLLFTIDKDMGWMSWLDYGMFIQNICVAARGQGLHTCPQASWAQYNEVLAQELALEEPEIVHVGMSLGVEDTEAPQNKLETVREPVGDFTIFHS